jgi:protein involved in polysaccharide export with SLBB domain
MRKKQKKPFVVLFFLLSFFLFRSSQAHGVYSQSFRSFQGTSPYQTPLQTLQLYAKHNNVPPNLTPSLSAVNPNRYALYPGDVVTLQIWDPAYSKITTFVSPMGTLDLGAVGEIPVEGVLLNHLARYLEKTLKKDYKQVRVSANLIRVRNDKIEILGNVNRPGEYTFSGTTGALNAIQAAGGLSAAGSLRQIDLKYKGKIIKTLDYFKWKMFGDNAQNPYLLPGETIYVPTLQKVVSISGNVKRPGTYQILPGDTYQDLLKMAGGYTPQADQGQIKLSRILPHHQEINLSVNPALKLKNGDSIYVPPISLFQEKIEVIGELTDLQNSNSKLGTSVLEPVGMEWYALHKNEKVKDVILNLGGFTPMASPSHAWIERKNSKGVKKIIPLNLHKLFAENDQSENLLLKAGDTLVIPPTQNSIYVLGAVHKPGLFPYIPGDGVKEYVALAGGGTVHGVLANVKVVRVIPGKTQPKVITVNLHAELTGGKITKSPLLQPGDVIFVPRNPFKNLNDILGIFTNLYFLRQLFP